MSAPSSPLEVLNPLFFLRESQPAGRTMLAKKMTYISIPIAMGLHFLQLASYRDGATLCPSVKRHLARFLYTLLFSFLVFFFLQLCIIVF